MYGILVEKVDLRQLEAREEIRAFLADFGLSLDADVDYTVAARDQGRLIGTCSKAGRVLKCFAVSEDHRGEGLSATLTTALIDRLFEEGIHHYFVFTMPDKTALFENLGFRLLCSAGKASLLEGGIQRIETRLNRLRESLGLGSGSDRGALVMNCNPFTLGHRHLVQKAAEGGREVLLFVVQEDRSVFRFQDRIELIQQGTADLPGVTVVPGTEYIISSATFPSYFLREADDRTEASMEIDASIFSRYFCPIFEIAERFVGEEPYCDVTRSYNSALERVLTANGIRLTVIPRLQQEGDAISASRVRALIREGRTAEIRSLVPDSTWRFITETPAGKEAAERIRNADTPH